MNSENDHTSEKHGPEPAASRLDRNLRRPTRRDPQSRRDEVITVAAEIFVSPDFPVLKGLNWQTLANRCNWSDKTITAEFGDKHTLQTELIDFMLSRPRARSVFDLESTGQLLLNSDVPLTKALTRIAAFYLDKNLRDPQFRYVIALWPYASHCERDGGSEEIRDRLVCLYDSFERELAAIFNQFLTAHDNIVRQRRNPDGSPYLPGETVAKLVIAMAEGISLRHSLDPATDNIDSLGRAFEAMFASMIQLSEHSDGAPGPPILRELEQQRRHFRDNESKV